MQNINFNDGFKIFDINGNPDRTIRINTADIGILERLENSIDTLNGLAEKAKSTEKIQDNKKYAFLGEIDKNIKEQINYVFGSDVSTPAFGTAYCFTFANGKPIFQNFLDAVIPIIEKDTKKGTEQMKSVLDEYQNQLSEITEE